MTYHVSKILMLGIPIAGRPGYNKIRIPSQVCIFSKRSSLLKETYIQTTKQIHVSKMLQ